MPLADNNTLTSMTVLKRKWPFRAALVDDAPDTAGVYALWDNATLLYVGRANGGRDTIRTRLLAHLRRAATQRALAPTHYGWEICRHPKEREAQVLANLHANPGENDVPLAA
jgi:excinuclease UvrABC nuclease subunit